MVKLGNISAQCNATRHGELQNDPTIFSGLTFSWPAAGSLGAWWRFAPYGLFGYEFDGDPSSNIWAAQVPRAVASLKIIVCGKIKVAILIN